jgi:hypothetical protein
LFHGLVNFIAVLVYQASSKIDACGWKAENGCELLKRS